MGTADARRGGQIQDALYAWCAHASGPSSRCRAPVTQKKPEAIPAFQATCHERLQRVIPPTNTRPVRVFSQDESRFGLLTVRRRRLTACGVQPVGPVQHVFEWFYVYGAVAPDHRRALLSGTAVSEMPTCSNSSSMRLPRPSRTA